MEKRSTGHKFLVICGILVGVGVLFGSGIILGRTLSTGRGIPASNIGVPGGTSSAYGASEVSSASNARMYGAMNTGNSDGDITINASLLSTPIIDLGSKQMTLPCTVSQLATNGYTLGNTDAYIKGGVMSSFALEARGVVVGTVVVENHTANDLHIKDASVVGLTVIGGQSRYAKLGDVGYRDSKDKISNTWGYSGTEYKNEESGNTWIVYTDGAHKNTFAYLLGKNDKVFGMSLLCYADSGLSFNGRSKALS